MRIKHAYNTLMNSESRKKYDSRSHASSYTYSNAERNQSRNTQEEEFYGLGKKFCPFNPILLYFHGINVFTCDGCQSTSILAPVNGMLMILR